MNYKEKLIAFNSTAKYKSEMDLARHLLDASEGEIVLDYGCGIGTFVEYLTHTTRSKVLGHDTRKYLDDTPEWFREAIYFDIDKVSFIHSIAHIQNLEFVLENLYERLFNGGRVVVITPNAEWLLKQKSNPDYIPDPTVVNHFTQAELILIFGQAGFKIKASGQFGTVSNGVNERIFLVAKK